MTPSHSSQDMVSSQISWNDFIKIDIRVGVILSCEPFPEARKPAYKLTIDFGSEIGIKRSSAQITTLYSCQDLIGQHVLAVVNFPPKQIGPFQSEVLTLGVQNINGDIVLVSPNLPAMKGAKLH